MADVRGATSPRQSPLELPKALPPSVGSPRPLLHPSRSRPPNPAGEPIQDPDAAAAAGRPARPAAAVAGPRPSRRRSKPPPVGQPRARRRSKPPSSLPSAASTASTSSAAASSKPSPGSAAGGVSLTPAVSRLAVHVRALGQPSQRPARLALARELFRLADTDASGTVEPAELVEFCRAALADDGDDESAADGDDDDDEVMTSLVRAVCLVIAAGGDAERALQAFSSFDGNKDGQLQLSEFERMADAAIVAAAATA